MTNATQFLEEVNALVMETVGKADDAWHETFWKIHAKYELGIERERAELRCLRRTEELGQHPLIASVKAYANERLTTSDWMAAQAAVNELVRLSRLDWDSLTEEHRHWGVANLRRVAEQCQADRLVEE